MNDPNEPPVYLRMEWILTVVAFGIGLSVIRFPEQWALAWNAIFG